MEEEIIQPDICESCTSKAECDRRDNNLSISWILEDQFIHCHEIAGKPEFKPDDVWEMQAIYGG